MVAREVAVLGIIVFVLAMAFFVTHFVVNTMVDSITNVTVVNESAEAVAGFQTSAAVTERLDYLIFIIFIGFLFVIIITGWFISGYPVLMFIYFIAISALVAVSTVFADIWEYFTQLSVFGTTIASFDISNQIIMNMPIYLAIGGFLGIIAMFAKPWMKTL